MYNTSLHFHFTGIGGSGMSGIAEVLLNLGFAVSGSDQKKSAVTDRLSTLGARIVFGHASCNLPPNASLVVYSSAVPQDNPELLEAKKRGLPVVRRAEVLAELMRLKFGVGVAGSHGKTTTTSMTAAILEHGGLDPTVVIGGQFQSSSAGSRLGKSSYLVAETDESDKSFLLMKPTVAIVTNIDNEHMNAYSGLEELMDSFSTFIESVPFYGLAILGIDDSNVKMLANKVHSRKLTYGFTPEATLRCDNLAMDAKGISYDVIYKDSLQGRARLALPARHLALNSLAAFAVGLEFGLSPDVIIQGLTKFKGVKRRLELIKVVNGVEIISDYGHHPTEIKATLAALRESRRETGGNLIVVFQPHRFSRTKDCFAQFIDSFNDCCHLVLTEIYPAGEEPLEGIDSARLCKAIEKNNKIKISEKNEIFSHLHNTLESRDVVLFLGAGSVGSWAEQFASWYEQMGSEENQDIAGTHSV